MANWSKRTTQTFKGSKNRITRTNSSKGTSTYSSSRKAGNTRITDSSSGGKLKVYTTEHHPVLGTKRTVRTVNPTVKYKKPKKPKKARVARPRSRSYSGGGGSNLFAVLFSIPYVGWVATAIILLAVGAAWYIWLIYISAFLKFEVDIFK